MFSKIVMDRGGYGLPNLPMFSQQRGEKGLSGAAEHSGAVHFAQATTAYAGERGNALAMRVIK